VYRPPLRAERRQVFQPHIGKAGGCVKPPHDLADGIDRRAILKPWPPEAEMQQPDQVKPNEIDAMPQEDAAEDSSSPHLRERRVHPRIEKFVTVQLMRYCNGACGPVEEVETRDLSASGICIVHSDMMTKGEQFLARPASRPDDPRWLLYRVTSCKRVADKKYRIGGEFMNSAIVSEPNQGLFKRMKRWLTAAAADPVR
jgi:hypothetical protein